MIYWEIFLAFASLKVTLEQITSKRGSNRELFYPRNDRRLSSKSAVMKTKMPLMKHGLPGTHQVSLSIWGDPFLARLGFVIWHFLVEWCRSLVLRPECNSSLYNFLHNGISFLDFRNPQGGDPRSLGRDAGVCHWILCHNSEQTSWPAGKNTTVKEAAQAFLLHYTTLVPLNCVQRLLRAGLFYRPRICLPLQSA